MSKSEENKFQQARKTMQTYALLTVNGKMTLKEILNSVYSEFDEAERQKKKKSMQRILDILCEEAFIEKEIRSRNKGNLYKVLKRDTNQSTINSKISGDETLAFFFLKSFMDSFEGTSISEEFNKISDLFDSIAPEEFIPENELSKIQMPGLFNFNIKPDILRFLLKNINEKTWIKILYKKTSSNEEKEYLLMPALLFFYEGIIYLAAYHYKAKRYLTFSVYNIISFEEENDIDTFAPELNLEKFKEDRFAVFDGEQKNIKLTIKSDMNQYFENRKWHPSQTISYDKDKNLILQFKSPIAIDLITWIVRWSDAIIKIQPLDLKNKVVEKLKESLNNFK